MSLRISPFQGIAFVCTFLIIVFIVLPLVEMVKQPSFKSLWETANDPDVLNWSSRSVLDRVQLYWGVNVYSGL
jgi:ABC-type sulfate transport system permease component